MATISVKIDLRQLKHIVQKLKRKDGTEVECLTIPITENNLFKGEKGVYLDLTAFELKEKRADSKDTHLVKQSLPKEVFEKMTDEEKRALPILGNAIVWERQESTPNVIQEAFEPVPEETDDLPF